MANNQLKEELILSTQHFDKKIDDVMKRMNKLQNQGNNIGNGFNNSMGKMVSKANGFNSSMGSLVGTITKLGGALGLITTGVQLSDWFKNAVQEGTKLAQEGEGIRLAFERLNRGDLLEKLREETHNTVTDLELMKQAVKFNDFNLNIDEMGTLLAFAQQKAKDTGQDIDYMVDSIVTGLGRKSLPILDNLGLSAAEIKEKMKDGGDMTKAVAEIIKEKMNEAGGYVETAADRAKQKEVELQNELTKLGDTFLPLTESSDNFWHSIEMGALRALNSIGSVFSELTELGRVMNNVNSLGGKDKVNRLLSNLGNGKSQGQKNIYINQLKEFDRYINERKQYLEDYHNWEKKKSIAAYDRMVAFQKKTGLRMFSDVKEQMLAAQKLRESYVSGANSIFNSKSNTSGSNQGGGKKGGNKGGSKTNTVEYAIGSVGYLENKISELQKKIKLQVDPSEIQKLQEEIRKTKQQLNELVNPLKPIQTTGLGSLTNTSNSLNIEKELKEFQKRKKLNTATQSTKEKLDEFGMKASTISESFFNFDDVINNLGALSNALQSGANAWDIFIGVLQTSMSVLQTISSVVETLTTLQELLGIATTAAAAKSAAASETSAAASMTNAAAKGTEATASATAGAAQIPYPYNLIAIATAVAAVLGALYSFTGFANGGIIGGSSYAGDNLLVRANSGEMILNTRQQSNLFGLLNRGAVGSANGGNVTFTIAGSTLKGVLRNYDDKMNKVR